MLSIAFRYIWYRFFALHRKGFGIHSPFVFHFITRVLKKKDDIGLIKIKEWRKGLSRLNETIYTMDKGAGSAIHRSSRRKVKNIIRWSSIPHKYGRVLYYLSEEFKPKTILELGTGLGISTAYLTYPNPDAKVISVEADNVKVEYAKKAIKSLKISQPEICNGSFDEILLSKLKGIEHPLLIFIDGDHRLESVLQYFKKILQFKKADTIVVFDDIRWSKEMSMAWAKIVSDSQTILSIDLFFMGIVLFRQGILKQQYKINF
jgi:predicted O-methyltransferase YrrM